MIPELFWCCGIVRDDLKKKSKLRDFDPKGREGSEKNQKFSLLEKRENHLRVGGVNSKSPFLFGNFIGKFCISFVRVLTTI